ncbi:carbonic anhydrase [Granulicella aggregans]
MLYFVFATVMLSPVALSAQNPETARHWDYSNENGPKHWSELDPSNSACSLGHTESPIDVAGAMPAKLTPLVFDYHPGASQVVDNGHTVQVLVGPGNYLIADGDKYQLIQFHFHHPSEDAIEGKHFDMELHMVHKDADGNLALVAILLSDGKANPLVQMGWDNVPTEKEKVKTLTTPLDPKEILPATEGYYSFAGSLTTPPCTEGVRWFVMQSPLDISVHQEQSFAALYPNNSRPIQPRNGRTVEASR